MVAACAVVKSGAAYVPVDPSAPAARLAYIARDCEVAGLVTTRDRAAALDEAFAGRAPMRALWFADLEERAGNLPRARTLFAQETVTCPKCGSTATARISEFGSTACKALYRCIACREPFEYFKPI